MLSALVTLQEVLLDHLYFRLCSVRDQFGLLHQLAVELEELAQVPQLQQDDLQRLVACQLFYKSLQLWVTQRRAFGVEIRKIDRSRLLFHQQRVNADSALLTAGHAL